MKHLLLMLVCLPAFGAIKYVDNAAGGNNDGSSWADAWTSLASVTGVSAGDTIYISGGASTKTYNLYSWLPPTSGGAGSNGLITFQTGQATPHNGMVVFNGSGNDYFWFNDAEGANVRNSIRISGNNGDGGQHMRFTNYGGGYIFTHWYWTNIWLDHLIVIEGSMKNAFGRFWHISYCTWKGSVMCDSVLNFDGSLNSTTWGESSIDHNLIEAAVSDDGNGWGDDGIRFANGGDINNNVIRTYTVANYNTEVQHSDGMQISGPYHRIYNNWLQDFRNSNLFFEGDGPARIYNNVITWQNQDSWFGMNVETYFGPMSDIIIANNLIAHGTFSDLSCIRFQEVSDPISKVTCKNNLGYNLHGETEIVETASTIDDFTNVNNLTFTTSWTGMVDPANYDFHLKSSDTSARNQGLDLIALCAQMVGLCSDKDGNLRPSEGAWDVGPYEYTPAAEPRVLRVIGTMRVGTIRGM